MKGDFTRDSFRPTQDYNRVLLQQGRVPLDADWNEAQAIDRYLERTGLTDVIGQSGVPAGDSFKVSLGADGQLHLGAGHLYVDGILVENRIEDYVIPNSAAYLGGNFFLYLDVTERHVTALEDPEIREKALGGVDTATRVKSTWKVAALDNGDGNPSCASAFSNLPPATSARLSARARRPDDVEACTVTPGSRYRRLENQLYRVEVHSPGDLGSATFKWSRDNGTVAATASIDSDRRISVSDIGRDAFLTFQTGGWIELVDSARDASDTPGDFFFVSRIEGNVLILDPNRPGAVAANYGAGLRARRWDSIHDVPFTDDDSGYMRLEDGIQVQITGTDFRTGDYWLIPARTIDSDVWWPQDGANPAAIPPHGIVHHYAPLAIAKFNGTVTDITDCRNEFVPLNHIKSLFYLGGDGQSFVQSSNPIPVATKPTVGVSRGEVPVKNALVRWTAQNGIGTVSGATEAVTVTDEFGVTSADWVLDGKEPSQSLTARLLDSSLNPTHLPVTFTATVNPAPSGGGCSHTVGERGEFPTIKDAIDQLVAQGEFHISLCLLPGEHLIDGLNLGNPKSGTKLNSLSIHGHLGGSQIRSTGPWAITRLKAFVLKDVYLSIEGGQFGIATVGCYEVRYENCKILGIMETPLQPILESAFVMDFLLRDSSILFATKKREQAPAPTDNPGFNNRSFLRGGATFSNIEFNESVTKRFPTEVQPLTAEGVKLSEFAQKFDQMNVDDKRFKARQTSDFLAEHRMEMSPDKQATLGQLAHELVQDQPDTEVVAALSARLQAEEEVDYQLGLGIAVTFNDAVGTQRIEDNTIVGFVTTYGTTTTHRLGANNLGTISEIWEEFPSLVLKPGGIFHFHNNACYGLLVGDRIADSESEFWKEMRQNEPPTTPDPVYVNAHISDNSFIFLGLEFFGSFITLESNSFFTLLQGDQIFALAILGYRATLSGNLSFVPQFKRLVCVPTSWGDFWNPGWVEAATLNLF